MPRPVIEPLGDSALLVTFGASLDAGVNARVHAAAAGIRARGIAAVREVVPAAASLAVHVVPGRADPLSIARDVRAVLDDLADDPATPPAAGIVSVPVCYDADVAPDLPAVAAFAGLAEAEVIERHLAPVYRVYMLGFLPGFPYLGPVDAAIAMPRRATPRARVARGSVGIAGAQTGIYPSDSPGGWQIIGRTPLMLFDASSPTPAALAPGAAVRFTRIGRADLAALEAGTRT